MATKPCGDAALTCPLGSARLVDSQPSLSPQLAVVGDAPYKSDSAAWNNGAGKFLERGLLTIGLRPRDVHCTNAILCECDSSDKPTLTKAAKACRPRLQHELSAIAAPVIVPTGPFALQSVLSISGPRPNIQEWRGSVQEIEYRETGIRNTQESLPAAGSSSALVAPITPPGLVQRAPQWQDIIELDVARLGRVLANGFTRPENQHGRQIQIARTAADLEAGLANLDDRFLAYDLETTGLDVTRVKITCLVLSSLHTALVIPWSRDLAGNVPYWERNDLVAKRIMQHFETRCAVSHNGYNYDHLVGPRFGLDFDLTRCHDTLNIGHVLLSHFRKSLAIMAHTFIDVPPWKSWPHSDSLETMMQYCARDGLYTRMLFEKLRKEVGV